MDGRLYAINPEYGFFGVAPGTSEQTNPNAMATAKVGEVRRDPMAMLPFCGYHMADYWSHWLRIGARAGAQLPKLYQVNWFRKGDDGRFLWPGFGDNSRVLRWIFERCEGEAAAIETPIGRLPAPGALDLSGLRFDADALATLTGVDVEGWLKEIPLIRDWYARFGDRLPRELAEQVGDLEDRLGAALSRR